MIQYPLRQNWHGTVNAVGQSGGIVHLIRQDLAELEGFAPTKRQFIAVGAALDRRGLGIGCFGVRPVGEPGCRVHTV